MKDLLIELLGGVTQREHERLQRSLKSAEANLEEHKTRVGTVINKANVIFNSSISGQEICDEDLAVATLLADGEAFVSGGEPFFHTEDKNIESRTCVYILCNDLFYWATADAEELPTDQIIVVYKMHIADPKWGTTKWCARRRKLRPQVPIVEMMKKDGAWDAEMEALPAPLFS